MSTRACWGTTHCMTPAINSDLWSQHVPLPPGEGTFRGALWQEVRICSWCSLPWPRQSTAHPPCWLQRRKGLLAHPVGCCLPPPGPGLPVLGLNIHTTPSCLHLPALHLLQPSSQGSPAQALQPDPGSSPLPLLFFSPVGTDSFLRGTNIQ